MRSSHFVLSLALVSETVLAFAGQTRPKIELQDVIEQLFQRYPQDVLTGILFQVNFVHTSDIHSWYRGHQKTDDVSRSWNANIGDVASFVHHMKEKAEVIAYHKLGASLAHCWGSSRARGKTFSSSTLEMTHTGGGLSDSGNPEGGEALAIHVTLPYDVMTPGNHELENRAIALNLYHNITSRLPDSEKSKYLASNVYITTEYEEEVPLAERYRIWTTRDGKGRKVAALGVSFENSKTRAADVRIQPIEEMIKEKWFVDDVLGSNPNIFLLVGHMSISDKDDKWNVVHAAIRERHPETPIFIFAGHSHRRDCRMNFDTAGRSIAIESGRYLETIGWVSAALTESKPLEFVRRYLDPSKDTFLRHSGVDKKSFDTEIGKDVMRRFNELAKQRGLDELYGCAPHTYNWDHEKYTKHAKDHVLNFYMDEVFPAVVTTKDMTTGEPNPYFLLLNNGFMRVLLTNWIQMGDGKLTSDNLKVVNTPYKQQFSFIRLPRLISERVLEMIDHLQGKTDEAVTDFGAAYGNSVGQTVLSADEKEETPLTLGRYLRNEIVERLTVTSPGYVTEDSCGQLGPGDDTIHSSPGLKIQLPPTYVHSRPSSIETLGNYDLVDFVTLRRLQDRVQDVVNATIAMHNKFCEGQWRLCRPVANVTKADWKQYGSVDSSDAIMEYARILEENQQRDSD
ncbi:hypothetical protein M407DRAFT_7693 [Tulasnella calospora MUT 4182]|uniref:Putative 5'-nucleotidase C-terminal domain-containing protein n=1 Tax=Tulasnella calospora MUT 4182 TaxID=1051891 RepID=A0A0C3Q9L2_9AGAM|nr:hypothetical protein M407DRAFT_7693 [Tulasnella calospora MUT 4182]